MRGATADICALPVEEWAISIHAPHAGCDRGRNRLGLRSDYFNPRTPCGVRRAGNGPYVFYRQDFNPRTPCGVRRQRDACSAEGYGISIHAPHAGCDPRRHQAADMDRYFNPRTPCGVRLPGRLSSRRILRHFNPRTPCGVRHVNGAMKAIFKKISIHAPHAGCDIVTSMRGALLSVFQSTHPMRGATP